MATSTLPEKFDELGLAMAKRLVERDEEIEIFLFALLAKTHAFFLGEPGVAKSMLVEAGIELIDGLTSDDYFHILFMKSTTREDVFGPLALSKLKEDRYVYRSEGFLPAAKLAFGDEFWKANGAIQNALLWATNERIYRNDGKVWDIPLHSMFIASNEMPEDDSLLAIYDRFPLRKVTKKIVEPGSFVNMLKMATQPKVKQSPVITWDEVEQACAEVQKVVIPDDVLEAVGDIRAKLAEASIYPSDRRFSNALDIVKAAAWRDGAEEADVEHLRPLRHVLWSDPEDYPAVDKMLTGLANPLDLEIMKIQEDLGKLEREIDSITKEKVDQEIKIRTGTQLYDKIESANEELEDIESRMSGSKRRSAKMQSASDQLFALTSRLLTQVFGASEDEIKNGLADFMGRANKEPE